MCICQSGACAFTGCDWVCGEQLARFHVSQFRDAFILLKMRRYGMCLCPCMGRGSEHVAQWHDWQGKSGLQTGAHRAIVPTAGRQNSSDARCIAGAAPTAGPRGKHDPAGGGWAGRGDGCSENCSKQCKAGGGWAGTGRFVQAAACSSGSVPGSARAEWGCMLKHCLPIFLPRRPSRPLG